MDDDPTNILVVDDLPEQLLVYRTILDELGQNLVTASSGEDALRAVLNHDFAVILLDVNMPRMSGLETAAMIRRRKRSAHTPIIFVTAFADEVRAAEGYAQGAVDYITTPIVPAVLRAKVRVFADLYRMNQQVRRQAEQRVALAEERTRREAVEEANRRLAFLARAGAILGQSLDQDVTAQDAVRLPVPSLADIALLITFHADGQSGKIFWARPGSDDPVVESLAGWPVADFAQPALVAEVERVIAGAAGEPGPAVAYPLQARGRVFAVLGLSREQSGRGFSTDERTLAEAYASRCASALENAQLYHELRQADRQKNEFLSMLAHELRNPLAPIRSANEVLRETGAEPGRVQWAQGVIDRQLGHMVRLVDDLLDISRLTLGKIRLVIEPVDLGAVVAQAVEATRPLIDRARHQFDVSLPAERVRLMGDRARLTQILTNMLNNAAKYTDPGGRLSLTAECGARGGQLGTDVTGSGLHLALGSQPRTPVVLIRVRDNGIGIAPELLPTVFDLFTQASRSLDRSQGGLGVGLALVRRLVEMHGGSVRAYSEGPGKGSEFVIELPVAVDEPQPPPEQPAPAPAGRTALRVVVVDDNVDGAESLATLLDLMGHEVRVAHEGPAGIAVVREFHPDLVLLDIGLPGMDGYEVARRLRREPGNGAVLAAVSGYGRDEDRRMAREAGFSHHFVKPVDLAELRRLLDSVAAARRT